MKTALEQNFEWYLEHQKELAERHAGKILMIENRKVVSVHENALLALKEARAKFFLGTILVQRCEPGSESVTETIRTRACFA